jgi:hypothetical protein
MIAFEQADLAARWCLLVQVRAHCTFCSFEEYS